jgi:hypothetical protein
LPDPTLAESFPAGAAAEAAAARADGAAVKDKTRECGHGTTQFFEGTFSCACCRAPIADAGRLAAEGAKMEAAQAEDAAIGNDEDRADHSARLGVTVTWLIAFTCAYNCWHWATWEVQLYIIKPATEHCRRRYADLPHVRGVPGAVGLAEIFVSRAPARPCAPAAKMTSRSKILLGHRRLEGRIISLLPRLR